MAARTPKTNTNQGEERGRQERENRGGTAIAETETRTEEGGITQTIQDTARQAGQKAQELASNVSGKAGEAVTSVSDTMTSLAGTIRQGAPEGGMVGGAASAVAGGLEAGGQYLHEMSFERLSDDLAGMIRRYPVTSVLLSLGVGCLLGAALCRR